MNDVVLGLLALLIGLFLCLRGQWALRILLAIWGAFIGLATGAGLVSAVGGDGFLSTALSWIVGVVLAIVFSALAYLYYAIGIVLAMAAMGFVLGGTLASALGATQNWLITLVGVVLGVLLAILAIVGDLPQILLIVLSALTGASLVVGGLMLLTGTTDTDELTSAETSAADHPLWYLTFVLVAVVGMATQFRQPTVLRGPVRDSWNGTPARH